ncbi:aminoglycoside phosphotransferase family protein [Desulfatiglans anilini]|uniref:aminoglycoside phosphotransferase family protein n=1 Tax=Desulfatiglans anilini TaxID=90728 RepID=UPI0004012C20|nr:phosphotransferase [Desulfatiglans anilini]
MEMFVESAVMAFLDRQGGGVDTDRFVLLKGDGSDRRFCRLRSLAAGGRGCVIMVNPPADEAARIENRAYVEIGRHLYAQGAPVPEIFDFDLEAGWVALEDLGDASLHGMVLGGAAPLPLYCEVAERLLDMQLNGAKGFQTAWCCQTPYYDAHVASFYEAEYFARAFLQGYLGLSLDLPGLKGAFDRIASGALQSGDRFFLHRDFQSRNIMWSGDRPRFIDWQGGRIGPLGYDLASLLIDPYAALSEAVQLGVYAHYLKRLDHLRPEAVAGVAAAYPWLALQRNLQILGAFAFLSKIKGKRFFEAYIPAALTSLQQRLAAQDDPSLQPLQDCLKEITF